MQFGRKDPKNRNRNMGDEVGQWTALFPPSPAAGGFLATPDRQPLQIDRMPKKSRPARHDSPKQAMRSRRERPGGAWRDH